MLSLGLINTIYRLLDFTQYDYPSLDTRVPIFTIKQNRIQTKTVCWFDIVMKVVAYHHDFRRRIFCTCYRILKELNVGLGLMTLERSDYVIKSIAHSKLFIQSFI